MEDMSAKPRKSNHPMMAECDKMIEALPTNSGPEMDAWHKKHDADHMKMADIMKKLKK
jgi:hypothetical protein